MPSGTVSMENWTTHSAQSSLGPGLLSVEGLLDREWIMGECVLSLLVCELDCICMVMIV